MKQENLVVKIRKKRKYSSYKGEISPTVSNVIERNFIPPVLLASWTISTCSVSNLINSLLDSAIALLSSDADPTVHSDRGCHYGWLGWIDRMDKAGLMRSKSKKGCYPDNSAYEGLFGRLKNEMFYSHNWSGVIIEQFTDTLNSYLLWYNEKRIKISLGNMSPKE